MAYNDPYLALIGVHQNTSPASAPPASFADQPGAAAQIKKRRKRKPKPTTGAPVASSQTGGSSSSPSSSNASSPTSIGNNANKNKNKNKNKKKPYNPLTARYKTPAELRAEAERLALLSVPTEQSLRDTQAREERNLQGMTDALADKTGTYVRDTQAGLSGLGSMYTGMVQGARTQAEEQLAAAGAAPGVAVPESANPAISSQLANMGLSMSGFVPAARATGAGLIGASQGRLSQALADRATRLSENTAKYLQQLQDRELERAVSQVTADQNATRLGLSAEAQAQDYSIDTQNLALRQESNAIQWQKAAQSAANAVSKAGKEKGKKVQAAKGDILLNRDKWTGMQTVKTGLNVYDVNIAGGFNKPPTKIQVVARDANEARTLGQKQAGSGAKVSGNPIFVREDETRRMMTGAETLKKVVPILVNAGMNRAAAIRWVRANLLS